MRTARSVAWRVHARLLGDLETMDWSLTGIDGKHLW
ncbi:hypothetical protein GGR46_001401 [Sphingomonas kyeonggiensis]|uniref:Uncharacterized protein n=1 Tax=Sphingomonas kyeonggiensis TaxID=1268553 RepID=A0A7W6NW63_9SPHN|nr:hypothetical protein [Sphingomonas kyeonggiensis]